VASVVSVFENLEMGRGFSFSLSAEGTRTRWDRPSRRLGVLIKRVPGSFLLARRKGKNPVDAYPYMVSKNLAVERGGRRVARCAYW